MLIEAMGSAGYSHQAFVQGGIDDEGIRHLFQNKLMHDMKFIPSKWEHMNNPHIPMLQPDGTAYLFKTGQLVRKPKPFFEIGLNNPLFW